MEQISPKNHEVPNSDNSNNKGKKNSNNLAWQYKILPWMIGLPTLLILAFIVLATSQVNRLNNDINNYKLSELDKTMPQPNDSSNNFVLTANMDYVKLYTLAKMEEEAMNRRYSQAGVLLMARVYGVYLGFFTGMLLAIVGAVFIISKLKEGKTNVGISYREQIKLELISTSPGTIFGFLGTLLMVATILVHNNIEVRDTPLFLNFPSMLEVKGGTSISTPNSAPDSVMKKTLPEKH
ncbi:MAG TPA: hypothetical protein VMH01_02670 [Puia sp.]|nr:hypothetical protein [Puia sp.]